MRTAGTVMHRLILLLLLLAGFGCSSPQQAPDSTAAAPAADPDDSFSEGEKDGVRRQVEKNWIADPGLPGLETMEVLIIVEMNPDGSVQSLRYDPASIRDDPNWKLFADSCRRAIMRASPLQMPADKPYAAWKKMTLVFYGRDMAGQT